MICRPQGPSPTFDHISRNFSPKLASALAIKCLHQSFIISSSSTSTTSLCTDVRNLGNAAFASLAVSVLSVRASPSSQPSRRVYRTRRVSASPCNNAARSIRFAPVLVIATHAYRSGFFRASAGWSSRTTKGKIMTTSKNERPIYRLTFSRITGKDDKGNDILARPKEIGAAWARAMTESGVLAV